MHSFPGAGCTVEPEGHIGHGAVLHGCTVRSGAMVGMNAVVMDGADIGRRALVGANAFIPAGLVVPADHLAAGNPGKVIKELDAEALAWKANGIRGLPGAGPALAGQPGGGGAAARGGARPAVAADLVDGRLHVEAAARVPPRQPVGLTPGGLRRGAE